MWYSLSSCACAPPIEPIQLPPTKTDDGAEPNDADSNRFDQRSAGACGAQDCQALITRAASDQCQCRKNSTMLVRLWVVNVIEVATPKLPPPPPRLAQYSALSWPGSQVCLTPSAVTMSMDRRSSQVSPYFRPTMPIPPPSVRPAMPTVGQDPPGTALPLAASPA